MYIILEAAKVQRLDNQGLIREVVVSKMEITLRLRRQQEKRCRSKVRHKCRPYHRPGSLDLGGQDCGRCPLRVQVPLTFPAFRTVNI